MTSPISSLVNQLQALPAETDATKVYQTCVEWYARQRVVQEYGEEGLTLLDQLIKDGWEIGRAAICGQGPGRLRIEKEETGPWFWPVYHDDPEFLQVFGDKAELVVNVAWTYTSVTHPRGGSYD